MSDKIPELLEDQGLYGRVLTTTINASGIPKDRIDLMQSVSDTLTSPSEEDRIIKVSYNKRLTTDIPFFLKKLIVDSVFNAGKRVCHLDVVSNLCKLDPYCPKYDQDIVYDTEDAKVLLLTGIDALQDLCESFPGQALAMRKLLDRMVVGDQQWVWFCPDHIKFDDVRGVSVVYE